MTDNFLKELRSLSGLVMLSSVGGHCHVQFRVKVDLLVVAKRELIRACPVGGGFFLYAVTVLMYVLHSAVWVRALLGSTVGYGFRAVGES